MAARTDPLAALARVRAARGQIPGEVRRLGWISFWTDAASELIYPLVPLFLTVTLHAPVASIGVIEGVGNAFSTFLRGPAGAWSDRHGRRRFVLGGYGLSSLAKPLLAVSPGWPVVLALRIADRVGKGLRSAPRDALIAAATPLERRGAAFGYHRAMDTLGAVLGPLLAIALLATGLPLRFVIAVAAAPAVVSLALLRGVREEPGGRAATRSGLLRDALRDGRLRWLLAGWVVFSLGNSSDAFLILRGSQLGLSETLVVLAYAAYNLVYAFASWPAGVLSDRIGRRGVLIAGLVLFALVYAGFAAAGRGFELWPLFSVYGLAIALQEGIVRALATDLAPVERVGGVVGLVTASGGVAGLVASVLAGFLWGAAGPASVFLLGAAGAALGALVLAAAPVSAAAPSR